MRNYDKTIFGSVQSHATPSVGSLLIAGPSLTDRYFRHSVVLLTDIDSQGVVSGFVMNRPSGHTIRDIMEIDVNCDLPLYIGGPVSTDRLFYIHTLGNLVPDSIEIADGLWFGGDLEKLISLIESGIAEPDEVRFFVGYSGWGEQQLADEIAERYWGVVVRHVAEMLFSDGEDAYWHRHVRLLGDDYRNWLYHPLNPQSN